MNRWRRFRAQSRVENKARLPVGNFIPAPTERPPVSVDCHPGGPQSRVTGSGGRRERAKKRPGYLWASSRGAQAEGHPERRLVVLWAAGCSALVRCWLGGRKSIISIDQFS